MQMFDVQAKRIDEYKIQYLNILIVIHQYDCIKNMTWEGEQILQHPNLQLLEGNKFEKGDCNVLF